jgi:hypothetical protein
MGAGVDRIGSSSLDKEGDFGSYFGEFGYRNSEVVLSGAVMKVWGEDIQCFDFRRGFHGGRNRL